VITRTQLRTVLVQSFSEEELRDLCFELNIDFELLPGTHKGGKTRSLIEFVERRNRYAELVAHVDRLRPEQLHALVADAVVASPADARAAHADGNDGESRWPTSPLPAQHTPADARLSERQAAFILAVAPYVRVAPMSDDVLRLVKRGKARYLTLDAGRVPVPLSDDELLQLAAFGYITLYADPPALTFNRAAFER
jgi:hypothetical protein